MSSSTLGARVSYLLYAASTFFWLATGLKAQDVVTKNGINAQADVKRGSGYITFYTTKDGVPKTKLSFIDKSFFTCKIGDVIFTNNDYPFDPTIHPNVSTNILRTGGVTTRRGPAGNDTLTTTWRRNGVDIMQDVWGHDMGLGVGQIVVRWRFKNVSSNPVDVTSQYLLDVEVAGEDGAKTLTRWGYKHSWGQYTRGMQQFIPPFFINFEKDLPNAPSFDPGLSGQGFFDHPLLIGQYKPWRTTIGNWPDLEASPFGAPALPPSGTLINDNAILLEYDPVGLAQAGQPGDEKIGAQMSYGSGDYETCSGNLFALLFYPKKLIYEPTTDRLLPNPFTFEAYVFNPQKPPGQTASNITLRLDVGDHLTITGPNNPPAGAKTWPQVPSPNFANAEDVTYAAWNVTADLIRTCSTATSSTLKLTGVSSFGDPTFLDCEKTVEIPCAQRDLLAPVVTNEILTEDSIRTLDVTDGRSEDLGLKAINFIVSTGPVSNLRVEIPTFTDCIKQSQMVRVTQLDSTIKSCIDFTFIDCAANISTRSYCFPARPRVIIPDTIAPRIHMIARLGSEADSICNSRLDSLHAVDSGGVNVGLMSVEVTPMTTAMNMRLVSNPVASLASIHRFSVQVIDPMFDGSISIRATDGSGNFTDEVVTYCTVKDTEDPVLLIKTLPKGRYEVTVTEVKKWDRLIDSVWLSNRVNVVVLPNDPTRAETRGQSIFVFTVSIVDTTKAANFCVNASDLAGNDYTSCQNHSPLSDNRPPVIDIRPPAATNPRRIWVNINDIHYYSTDSVDRDPYDTGIDSIWITGLNGWSYAQTIPRSFTPNIDAVPIFEMWVTDTTTLTDSTVCFTIHARDSAVPPLTTSKSWCFPITPDTDAPRITGIDGQPSHLDLQVSDSRQYDRGMRRVEVVQSDNFKPFPARDLDGDTLVNVRLEVEDRGRSSTATISAIDRWGSNSPKPEIKDMHTTSIDVAIWVQPLQMQKSHLIEKSGEFAIPVYLLKNDDYRVDEKGIFKYEFGFDVSGDTEVEFVRPETAGTLSDGWTVVPNFNGRAAYLVATAPPGVTLAEPAVINPDDSTPVLNLIFRGAESEITKSAQVTIVPKPGKTALLLYNDDVQTTITKGLSSAILPAPQGSIGGATIVVVGTCAPSTQTPFVEASSIGLFASVPNPVHDETSITYITNADGLVRLRVFNIVGEMVMSLVEGHKLRGEYTARLDASGLPAGTYFVQLEASGKRVSKSMLVQH